MVIQRIILKVILKKPSTYPTDLIFSKLKILDVRQLFIKFTLIHIFKNQHMFKKQDNHLHNTRNLDAYILETPRRFKQKGQQHGEFIGPRIFNQLPYSVRSLNYRPRFKREVHRWLLNYGRDLCKDLLYF